MANPSHDLLYDKGVMIVRSSKRASIPLLQRHLRIGYNRAAGLLEAMGQAGIVVPLHTGWTMPDDATPPSPSTGPRKFHVKDHVVREVVNSLRDTALEFHGHQSLRERLAAALDPLLPSPSTAPEVDERAIAELALTRARMLGTAGMEFAAHLCLMGVRTIDGIDYIPRDGVMNEVAAWRRAFDTAPEVNEAARRALASRPAEVDDEGLPKLPEQHEELRARWKCDSCDGRGHDGELHYQGEWQPPEPYPCSDCDGAGQVAIEAYTADQYRQGQRDAVAADRAREWFVVGGRRIGRTYMAKLAHDAARYRWLRESNNVEAVSILDMHSGDSMDARVDQAMALAAAQPGAK